MSEKRINFGKIAYYGSQKKVNQVEIEIELKECKEGPVFSACAFVYNSRHTDCVAGGQCLDSLLKFFSGNEDFRNIYMLWERNHLNDMHAGTVLQEQALSKAEKEGCDVSDYSKACDYLRKEGLYEDNGYVYGSGWLYRPISDEDLKLIKHYLEA